MCAHDVAADEWRPAICLIGMNYEQFMKLIFMQDWQALP